MINLIELYQKIGKIGKEMKKVVKKMKTFFTRLGTGDHKIEDENCWVTKSSGWVCGSVGVRM
jgi:hypothetical protein